MSRRLPSSLPNSVPSCFLFEMNPQTEGARWLLGTNFNGAQLFLTQLGLTYFAVVFFPNCVVIFFPFLSPAVPLKPTNWFDEWWVSERDALADAHRLPQQGGRSFEMARSKKKCHAWNKCLELVAINGSDGWGFFLVVAVVATPVNFQLNGGLAVRVHAQS